MNARALLPVVLVLFVGCAKDGFARFNALPKVEQDAFDRCTDGLHDHPPYTAKAKTCMGYGAMDDRFQPCWEKLRGEYADLASDAARNKWLADDGCPPAVIAGK